MFAGPTISNLLSDLSNWANRSAPYNGINNNAIFIASDSNIQQLSTAIGYVYDYHNDQQGIVPADMLIFVRNNVPLTAGFGDITAYSICPNPVGSASSVLNPLIFQVLL